MDTETIERPDSLTVFTKTYHPTDVKFDDKKGSVLVEFATLNVIDADGDVTLPGFFGEQEAAIIHAHRRDRAALGKGRIFEKGDKAIFDGRYFLSTDAGKQAYLTVKEMGSLQEWSYSLRIVPGGAKLGMFDDRNVRFLQPVEDGGPGVQVDEVSTVLKGAGVDTRTVAIKSDGLRFVDQAEKVAQAAELLFTRAEEIKQMRAEKGSTLGDEALARLAVVKTRLENVATMLTDLTYEPSPVDPSLMFMEARRTLARSIEIIGE